MSAVSTQEDRDGFTERQVRLLLLLIDSAVGGLRLRAVNQGDSWVLVVQDGEETPAATWTFRTADHVLDFVLARLKQQADRGQETWR